MYPFNTLNEYQRKFDIFNRRKLIEEAETMASWAVPSHESTGYSQRELASMIKKLVRELKTTL